MSDISVTVTGAGTPGVTTKNGDTYAATVGNGGSVSVAIGSVTGTSPAVVSGTVEIGKVTTLAPGSNATVTNEGTGYHAILSFGIPQGTTGATGDVSGLVPKAGAAMDPSAVLTFSNGTTDSEVGGWGFGVELTASTAENATVEYNAVTVQNSTQSAQLTPAGLSLSNGTAVTLGSFDNSTGGANGIGLICAVGYELNWQGGRLRSVQVGGDATPQTILSDSPIAFPGTGKASVAIDSTGITFADGTTQTTAATGGGGAVTSVAGRTGAVTLSASDVSGLASVATSGSASDLSTGTLPAARLPAATDTTLGAIKVGTGLSITSGVLSATGGSGGVSWVSPPSTPTSTGTAGQFAQNSTYLFACYGTNQWLRVLRASWIVPPGQPTIISTSGDAIAETVTVFWNPPTNDGGELTGYRLTIDTETPVTVGPQVNQYSFDVPTFTPSECNDYTVTVAAVNSAGESTAASTVIMLPQTTVPTIYNVIETPNEMGPGVQYGVYWFPPCIEFGAFTESEVQTRLYYNGAEVVVTGDEDGWESFYSGPYLSHTAWVSTATGSQQWQFRVRVKNVVGGTLASTSGWSYPATS